MKNCKLCSFIFIFLEIEYLSSARLDFEIWSNTKVELQIIVFLYMNLEIESNLTTHK